MFNKHKMHFTVLSSCRLWSFIVHTGKETILQSPLLSKGTPRTIATVLKLSEPHSAKAILVD
jgi:hypothetical protein